MKNYKIFAALIALAAALAVSATPARAQADAAAAAVAAPIIARAVNAVTPKSTPKGDSWLKAEVVRADGYTIIVREAANGLMIHTFTFTPQLKDRMQAILDKGGYQYGDKVKILYQPGQTVALKVVGKPSKPL